MVWALALVVVIGAGLPVGAWAVTRRLPPPRLGNRLGVGYDPVDKWLLTQYQLPPHDRWRVREAVLRGDRVNDPGLARVAHRLAADLLANRFLPLRFLQLFGWVMSLGGTAFAIAGIIMLATPSGSLAQGVVSLIDSGLFLSVGTFGRRNARQVRRKLSKALQLNGDGAVDDT
jgi:hypothetical protein